MAVERDLGLPARARPQPSRPTELERARDGPAFGAGAVRGGPTFGEGATRARPRPRPGPSLSM